MYNYRYLGYANEVGEALGPLYPRVILRNFLPHRVIFTLTYSILDAFDPQVVRPSYVIAFGYVGCDTIDKTYRSYKAGRSSGEVRAHSSSSFSPVVSADYSFTKLHISRCSRLLQILSYGSYLHLYSSLERLYILLQTKAQR